MMLCTATTVLLLVLRASSASQEWSTCSRSCGGGISSSIVQKEEEEQQHQICNMQPCPDDGKDFRGEQCAQHNGILHQGRNFSWEAFIHEEEPCALWCQATEDVTIKAKLESKVVDGTRCSHDSLDVCINGTCQGVGCDLMVGSSKKLDSCGVCGGHDICENKVAFVWSEVAISHCSAPCGGGYMMARSVCQNNSTKEVVLDDLCNVGEKPASRMAPCNGHPCPARWEVEDWQACSQSCGGGLRTRLVKCIIDKDSEKVTVPDEKCPDLKPPARESCNIDNCPQWYAGIWSECNMKCGQGLQHRNVVCRDGHGYPSGACNFAMKPLSRQPCTGIDLDCSEKGESREKKTASTPSHGNSVVTTGWMKLDSGILKPPPPSSSQEVGMTSSPEEESEAKKTEELPVMNATAKVASTSLLASTVIPSEPTLGSPAIRTFFACGWLYVSFIVEDWGPCSSPCGEGIRERKVECKIFLEFSKTVAVLPDHECPGPKPPTTEICFSGLCHSGVHGPFLPPVTAPLRSPNVQRDETPHRLEKITANDIEGAKYKWQDVGFTACSESCLGGLQESKIICVNEVDDPVSPMHCDMSERPEVIVRTCNDHPCPPRWNVSDFSGCSKTCGGGIQTRVVTCIQEVRHGGNNILRVDDSFCPQPPPITQQFCSVLDCPPKWKIGPWSECSKKCGGGFKVRQVICQQLLALGELANKPDRDCPNGNPEARKPCNNQPCSFSELSQEVSSSFSEGKARPLIKANLNQVYEQLNLNQMTVKLKVGGVAKVFKGTKLKIRCPVKKFDRSAIQWARGDQLIPPTSAGNKRSRKGRKRDTAKNAMNAFVTRKGSLRIPAIGYHDAGTYTCMADGSSAQIEIIVKPRDSNDVIPDDYYHGRATGWDYEKGFKTDENVYGVVKHVPDDFKAETDEHYTYAQINPTENDDSHRFQLRNHNDNLHMRFNTANGDDNRMTTTKPSHHIFQQNNAGDHNHLRFNEVNSIDDEDEDGEDEINNDISNWKKGYSDFGGDNTINWSSSDYPNNPAKSKVTFGNWKRHLGTVVSKDYYLDEEEADETIDSSTEASITAKNMALQWTTSEWSRCSQTCGENGTQFRTVECVLIRDDQKEEIIPSQICVDSGLGSPPESVRTCGLSSCPRWVAQAWTPCGKSKCIAKQTGFQTRDVFCSVDDKTTVEDRYCEAVLRPRSSQTCNNRKCRGIWKTSDWSECDAICGDSLRRRKVECVWKNSGELAGDACNSKLSPNATKQCNLPPCTTTPTTTSTTTATPASSTPPTLQQDASCKDSTKYCGLIVTFKMCHKDKYKRQCCLSCT